MGTHLSFPKVLRAACALYVAGGAFLSFIEILVQASVDGGFYFHAASAAPMHIGVAVALLLWLICTMYTGVWVISRGVSA